MRVYSFFLKKKIKLSSIIKIFAIILLSIPVKFLKLFCFFIFKNKKTFTEGAKILYYTSYFLLKDCKIEIFNKNIYLNCRSVGKLLKHTKCQKFETEELVNFLKALKTLCVRYYAIEINSPKLVELPLAKIKLKEGFIINPLHYTHQEGDHSLHATSNIPKLLFPSQKATIPMISLVKKGALNPGTLINLNSLVSKVGSNAKIISAYELENVKRGYEEFFKLDRDIAAYLAEKDAAYRELFRNHLGFENLISDDLTDIDTLFKELTGNAYTNIFVNISDSELWQEVLNFKNDPDSRFPF